MSDHSLSTPFFAPVRPVSVGHGWRLLMAMLEARRTRRLLGEMDAHMLADIGVGRGDALVEASRPMWDLTPVRR